MRNLRATFSILFILFTISLSFAQNNNSRGDNYGNNNNRNNNSRRFNRQCTEPFPLRSFNRDYAGMSNANYYHLDKTLREYSRLHCLSAEQVRRLALLYPTDREKYDYLTYGLTYVFDIENYALAGTVLANRNARDAFYRFLVREGVPAGDYYADPYFAQGGYYNNGALPPPQYYDRYGNAYNNQNNRNSYDNQNNNQNNPYDNYGQSGNNGNNNFNNPNNRNNQNGINAGYQGLMTYKEFEVLKEKIRQNTFDKGKLDAAKTTIKENTLTANQIAEITRLFNYDSNRLEFAKFALDFAYDRENYAAVTDAMAFEVNKKELQRYVESRREK